MPSASKPYDAGSGTDDAAEDDIEFTLKLPTVVPLPVEPNSTRSPVADPLFQETKSDEYCERNCWIAVVFPSCRSVMMLDSVVLPNIEVQEPLVPVPVLSPMMTSFTPAPLPEVPDVVVPPVLVVPVPDVVPLVTLDPAIPISVAYPEFID